MGSISLERMIYRQKGHSYNPSTDKTSTSGGEDLQNKQEAWLPTESLYNRREQRVVLQKHEEKTKGRSFPIFRLYLNGYSEQCCDKLHLLQAISFAHSLYLSFSHHIYCFISL